jgi:hypothetical protein
MGGDYLTSLECFTVLDTCSGSISDNDRKTILIRLQKEVMQYDAPKQKLAGELIAVLKG